MVAGDDLLQAWQQKAPAENGARESSPETSVSCLAPFYPAEEENPGGRVGSETDQACALTLADSPRGLFSIHRVGPPRSLVGPQSPSPEISGPASLLTRFCSTQERKRQALGTQDPTRQQGPCPRRVTA
uniref:Uncharacterized protein n=1 Tax=Rangifer tarandus platyrhynchus TaxID=3082113 RepID=A0ACB0F1M7_RANTA|nr:unnamed protein product [Rangifer tarandus platyrhynchus]